MFVQKRGLIDVVTDKSIGRHVLLGAHSHAPIVVFVQKLGLLVDYLSNESRHSPAKLHMYSGGGGEEGGVHTPLFGYVSC